MHLRLRYVKKSSAPANAGGKTLKICSESEDIIEASNLLGMHEVM